MNAKIKLFDIQHSLFDIRYLFVYFTFSFFFFTIQIQRMGRWSYCSIWFYSQSPPTYSVLLCGHTPAYELTVSKQTLGDKYWQQHYHYPVIGYSFIYINLKNDEQLGTGSVLSPHQFYAKQAAQVYALF